MVYLNRIYTKAGDAGQTMLGSGDFVPKTSRRIAAYGAVDELNACLGVALLTELPPTFSGRLQSIQNDLFDLGADLCVPEQPAPQHTPLRITEQQVERLESWIDEWNEPLAPLTSFILPGGSPASAHLHVARTVCRRAEIAGWALSEHEQINSAALRYLNRLSDLLFVAARACNAGAHGDVLWKPGQSRDE
ncbi:MAG: cob(I)yrinic acid a,c-diamide adenosyltransferase [Planctomycetaceae bacterium]|nr:cob(I)yrinic acid a,c-diamide adenosyltransferase [Planctomycetaceae bacterium]